MYLHSYLGMSLSSLTDVRGTMGGLATACIRHVLRFQWICPDSLQESEAEEPPKPKPAQPERRRSVQISDVKDGTA